MDDVCLRTRITDRAKSTTIFQPCHGYAEPVRRYLVRHVCGAHWWTRAYTVRKHWPSGFYRRVLFWYMLLNVHRMLPSSRLYMGQHRTLQVCYAILGMAISERVSAGKGLANPTALLLSSLMMLRYVRLERGLSRLIRCRCRHMNLNEHAARIERATLDVSGSRQAGSGNVD